MKEISSIFDSFALLFRFNYKIFIGVSVHWHAFIQPVRIINLLHQKSVTKYIFSYV